MRRVSALDRGLRILELVAQTGRPMKVSEIAAQLALPRSVAYELVYTLKEHGALEVGPGRLQLGRLLFVLGSVYAQSLDLAREANEVAQQVMRQCDETVQVAVLDGRHVLYISKADSTRMLRLVSAVGRRLPAHCTALGKVLLTYLDPHERTARLKGVQLEQLTPNSITSFEDLERELALVRDRGYAFDECESNPDVCCVAAPVRDSQGHVVAAMSISVPLARFDPERRQFLRELVTKGAEELSQRLGHTSAIRAGLASS